jgi:hypothetical protein
MRRLAEAASTLEVLRIVLQSSKGDVNPYTGLGEAELSRWNYRSACDAYCHPLDSGWTSANKCWHWILSVPGLRTTECYRRSRKQGD